VLKKILPYVKYPYATGMIVVIWLGTLAFFLIDNQLPIVYLVIVDSIVTLALLHGSMK
jgi:hypothetical protein